MVERNPPDVVVLDLALGDGSDPGTTVSRVVAAGSRVLVYSVLDNPRMVRSALAAGAHGLSRKSEPLHVTIDKLRQVAQGQTLVSPEILAMIDGDADFVRARLSEREREVLVLYVSGLEISQIAQQLFVTENSAREYLRRIRAKYTEVERPASTKVDLLRRAIEDGIVPPIEPALGRDPSSVLAPLGRGSRSDPMSASLPVDAEERVVTVRSSRHRRACIPRQRAGDGAIGSEPLDVGRRQRPSEPRQASAAETTSRAASWTWARCSGPRNDSA